MTNKNNTNEETVEENDPDIEKTEYMWVWLISIFGSIAVYFFIADYTSTLWLKLTGAALGFVLLFIVSAIFRKYIAIVGAFAVVAVAIYAFIEGFRSA